MERQPVEVSFESGDATCRAWFWLPATLPASEAPHPVIVMAHGLGGVRGMRLDAYAEQFTAAGYACLVFDYRHFGDSGGQPRQLLDISQQLADWSAAVAFTRSRREIDPTRPPRTSPRRGDLPDSVLRLRKRHGRTRRPGRWVMTNLHVLTLRIV